MVEVYGVQLIQMMENAGRNLAELVRRQLGGSVVGKSIVVAAGRGNNGGGGMVAARHLSNWGAEIKVLRSSAPLSGVSELQSKILERLSVEKLQDEEAVRWLTEARADVVVDALIGYGLTGPPRAWVAEMIQQINQRAARVISLDVPSGFDATAGEALKTSIRAHTTMTLALPKVGLLKAGAKQFVGTLFLADIGVPDAVYRSLGISTKSIFSADTLLQVEN